MGKHYIPRFYLKGFTESENSPYIWVYDKELNTAFRANINNIAQEKKMYSHETESYLAREIEEPAKPIIRKIRNGQIFTLQDKEVLSKYMAVLIKRVPKSRERTLNWFKDYEPAYYKELDEELQKKSIELPEKKDFFEKRRLELKRIHETGVIKPEEIWEDIFAPEKTPIMSSTIQKMTWLIFIFDKWPVFLTNDNPVFFFDKIGIGKKISELSFPLSHHIALWASWRQDLTEQFVKAKKNEIHEINRRTVAFSHRFVYFSKKEKWISKLINNPDTKLSKIIP